MGNEIDQREDENLSSLMSQAYLLDSRQLPVSTSVDVAEMLEHQPEFGAQFAVPRARPPQVLEAGDDGGGYILRAEGRPVPLSSGEEVRHTVSDLRAVRKPSPQHARTQRRRRRRSEAERARATATDPAGRVARRAHPRRDPRRRVPRHARPARRSPHQGRDSAHIPRHHGRHAGAERIRRGVVRQRARRRRVTERGRRRRGGGRRARPAPPDVQHGGRGAEAERPPAAPRPAPAAPISAVRRARVAAVLAAAARPRARTAQTVGPVPPVRVPQARQPLRGRRRRCNGNGTAQNARPEERQGTPVHTGAGEDGTAAGGGARGEHVKRGRGRCACAAARLPVLRPRPQLRRLLLNARSTCGSRASVRCSLVAYIPQRSRTRRSKKEGGEDRGVVTIEPNTNSYILRSYRLKNQCYYFS